MTSLLTAPVSFDLRSVRDLLGARAARFDVDHVAECDSTNTRLLERAAAGSGSGTVLVADAQTAGRGRRGRSWVSAPGDSLCFSVLWHFPPQLRLEGLSLAVGLAVVRGLVAQGVRGLALKWPNDIWLAQRKLGGVLVEVGHGARGDRATVIGIGLNLRHNADWAERIGQDWTALDAEGYERSREVALAAILSELFVILENFAQRGFEPLAAEWCALHALAGAEVRVEQNGQVRHGRVAGVDALGRLQVDSPEGSLLVFGGEVSLRPL